MIDIADIIMQIRAGASAVFGNRVHGAAEYKGLTEQDVTNLATPSAYVIPTTETAIDRTTQGTNTIQTDVTFNFVVVVIVDNTSDRVGLAAVKSLSAIRAALWAAILNWPLQSADASPIRFRGGRLIEMNRGRLSWGWDFSYAFTITPADGYQGEFNDLTTIYTDVDMIEPNNGTTGPDGQIDAEFQVTFTP